MGNSKDEVIKYMKLQSDLHKLVEEWELLDTMQANMTSRDYLIRYLVERTRAIKKLLEGK